MLDAAALGTNPTYLNYISSFYSGQSTRGWYASSDCSSFICGLQAIFLWLNRTNNQLKLLGAETGTTMKIGWPWRCSTPIVSRPSRTICRRRSCLCFFFSFPHLFPPSSFLSVRVVRFQVHRISDLSSQCQYSSLLCSLLTTCSKRIRRCFWEFPFIE